LRLDDAGVIEQVGSPMELYLKPKNKFVAGFIGSPKMNFIAGQEAQKIGADSLGIRPEHFTISKVEGQWSATVGVLEHLGSETFIHLDMVDNDSLIARVEGGCSLQYGDKVYLSADTDKIHYFSEDGRSLIKNDA